MLTKRREKLAFIHIVKKELGIADKDYRALLREAAGVRSAADLKNDIQYFALMRAFRAAGYKPHQLRRERKNYQQGYHCTRAQLYYIKGLWKLASREKTENSLRAMVRRIAHVDDLRFLSRVKASKLILALRDIAEKAGFDPDGSYRERNTDGRV